MEYLKQYIEKEAKWDLWVNLASYSYNTSIQEDYCCFPFELVFLRIAKLPSHKPPTQGEQLPTYQNYLVDLVTRLNEIRKLSHDNLIKTKEISKMYHDRKLNIQDFRVGNKVFLLKGARPGKL